ncbi:MAG: NAD(P)/FAD-dependent oxidoreductase [Alphaproteobacteria bacterium]|nr:NAD(P)/FAD-dependent oxidoreductase [Alphaproteobacteria bacterium]MCB9695599.1 NAD(P)/FAD-dependent oxidoreductase [Alphaproteobacteria bacterium]
MSQHAVVIGSGMGGLTAARLLQKRGYEVTVLEQHYRPGGLLHRFFRKEGAFDTGFHYCGGIGPGQPLGQALRHLGVMDKLEFHPLDPDGFDILRFPDAEIRVPAGWEAYTERMVETFPHEERGLREVIARMQTAVDAYGLYRFQQTMDLSPLLDVEGISLETALCQHLTDPRARAALTGHAVLYGVPPREAPFGQHALIMDHFLSGPHALVGGGDRLGLALTRRIRADGGKVRLRTEATHIEVEGGEAKAVWAGEERIEADVVISNLHPRLTLQLLPEHATRKAYKTRVAETRVGYAHLGVYMTVDGRVPSIGRANFYGHPSWDIDTAFREIRRDGSGLYFACSPTEHHGEPYPEVGRILMLFPMLWDQVSAWADTSPDERPAEYVELKQALQEAAVDRLLTDHPDLRGRVRSVESSTPLSTMHYTRSPEGATYGHYHSVDQMGRYRPSATIRVKNLRLVGQGVFSPGVLGATLSAYYALGSMFGDMERTLTELRDA